MDRACYLQLHRCLPLPRKRSPNGAYPDWGCGHLIAAYHSFIYPRKDERLSVSHVKVFLVLVRLGCPGKRAIRLNCRCGIPAESNSSTSRSWCKFIMLDNMNSIIWTDHIAYCKMCCLIRIASEQQEQLNVFIFGRHLDLNFLMDVDFF